MVEEGALSSKETDLVLNHKNKDTLNFAAKSTELGKLTCHTAYLFSKSTELSYSFNLKYPGQKGGQRFHHS